MAEVGFAQVADCGNIDALEVAAGAGQQFRREAALAEQVAGLVEGGQLQIGVGCRYSARPYCMGVLTVNTLNWCTLRNSAVMAGAATVPTFQPVTWKVLPKLDDEARAARPAKRARRSGAPAPSNTICSYTSSPISRMLVGPAVLSARMSSAVQMVALGLCGLLMMSRRVRGVMAAAIFAKSGRKLPA